MNYPVSSVGVVIKIRLCLPKTSGRGENFSLFHPTQIGSESICTGCFRPELKRPRPLTNHSLPCTAKG